MAWMWTSQRSCQRKRADAASFFFLFSSFFFSFFLLFSSLFFSFFLLFLSCSDESHNSSLLESPAGGEGAERRGSPGGVGLRGRSSFRWRWGWRLSSSLSFSLELGLPAAAPVDVGEAVHKSFIKPVHNLSVHNWFMIHL